MGYKCCVRQCRGNYAETKTHPKEKVSAFSFPKDEELRAKWISAIKREKTFKPTENSKVCEKHFNPSDIIRETIHFDDRTGRTLSAKLKNPRLKTGTIPITVQNCPDHLSAKDNRTRESPEQRRVRKKQERVAKLLAEEEQYMTDISFDTFEEFLSCLKKYPPSSSKWIILHAEENVLFIDLMREPIPTIRSSVCVNNKCEVSVAENGVQVKSIDEYDIPFTLKNINELNDILNAFEDDPSLINRNNNNDLLKYHTNVIISHFDGILESGRLSQSDDCKMIQYMMELTKQIGK